MAHHLEQRLAVARRYDAAVLALHNDFVASVDVSHDRRQAHGAGLHHHMGEALAVAGEHQCIGCQQIRSHILLVAHIAHRVVVHKEILIVLVYAVLLFLKPSHEDKSALLPLTLQPHHGACQLVHAFIFHEAADEDEGEHIRLDVKLMAHLLTAGMAGLAREAAGVDAVDIAMMHHLQRFLRDAVGDERCLDALSLGNHFRGQCTGQPLHGLQQHAALALRPLVAQAGDEVDAVRHPHHPCRHHSQQTAFRRVGMHDVRVLFAEEMDEIEQAGHVAPQRYLAPHGQLHHTDALTLGHVFQQAGVSRHAHHLVVLVEEAQLTLQQQVEADV